MIFFIVLIMIGVAEAHSGNRLYPFYELTDEMLEKIDLHDGFIDEWYEIGEPNMTLLDFKTNRNFIAPDPSNLDFRIWLAWHDRLNRIYAAFVVSDDEYKNDHDWSAGEWSTKTLINHNDSIRLYLDADHSGGRGFVRNRGRKEPDGNRILAISQTVSGPTLEEEANPGFPILPTEMRAEVYPEKTPLSGLSKCMSRRGTDMSRAPLSASCPRKESWDSPP